MLRLRHIITGAGIVLPLLAAGTSWAMEPADGVSSAIEYKAHPSGPWGPIWGHQVPPGRPDTLPSCSTEGAAAPYIEDYARGLTDDAEVFVPTMLQLARKESGQMFRRPANNFDSRPDGRRPAGKPLITADGVWQWNKGAWINAGHMAALGIPGPDGIKDLPAGFLPYMLETQAEMEWPLDMYGQIWRWARRHGATPLQAAQAVHAWQKGSRYGKDMLTRGRDTRRWDDAYAQDVPNAVRNNINTHLRAAGVA